MTPCSVSRSILPLHSLYSYDPELIPVGLLLRLRGKRVIYDVHEDYPLQHLSKDWIPGVIRIPLAKATAMAEWLAGRLLDGIVAATPAIGAKFPTNKTVIVQNFPVLQDIEPMEKTPYCTREHRIVYVGGISALRGAYEMIRALDYVNKRLQLRLSLAGHYNPPELQADLQQMPGWERVESLGWLSRAEVNDLLENARIGLVVLHPIPNYLESYPVKLFEYMAAGLPVIASDFPLWRNIIESVGCGLVVDPLDPRAIGEAIQWLLEHPEAAEEMGRRGQRAVLKKYNWDREAVKLLTLYRALNRDAI